MELGTPTIWLKDKSVMLTYGSYEQAREAFEAMRKDVLSPKPGWKVLPGEDEYYRYPLVGEI